MQQRAEVTSCGWYHGALSRVNAEALVRRDGEYLMRDSSTQAGSYVLTLRWAGASLHFVINQRPSSDVGTMLYHFEEDAFRSVSELLDWYVRQRKPITESSGAIASVPVMRAPDPTTATPPRRGSPERPHTVPTFPRFTAVDIPVDDATSASLPAPIRGHQRVGSEPLLSPQPLAKALSGTLSDMLDSDAKNNLTGSDSDLTRPPPPKPTRLPTIRIGRDEKRPIVQIRNPALYEDDGKDYSDYWQVRSFPSSQAKADEDTYDTPSSVRVTTSTFVMSDYVTRSQFDQVSEYESQFLPPDNRPLDSSALTIMKSLVLDTLPQVLARHITLFDINLIRIIGDSGLGFGLSSGLELITLPQGSCLRQDIIERFHCLQLLVSVLILRSSNAVERVRMLNHWIQTAIELRHSTIGNLYSFSAVMHALFSAPISRLNSAWQRLADQFAASSSTFQLKLCPLQRSLDASSGTLPLQSITVPHVLPLAELLEAGTGALDRYTLDAALAHMDLARLVAAKSRLYSSTAQAMMASRDRVDPALMDMIGTMTHMKLLWGARGVGVQRHDRLAKFAQVLAALSDKAEPRESSL